MNLCGYIFNYMVCLVTNRSYGHDFRFWKLEDKKPLYYLNLKGKNVPNKQVGVAILPPCGKHA